MRLESGFLSTTSQQEKDWLQIVGVVGDVKDRPDSKEAQPAFWWPLAQVPFRDTSVAVRSNSDPALLANQVRLAVRQIDPGLAVADLRLMNDVANAAVASHRFTLFLVGLFAALALVLATIGIYGVISYSVNQRMQEFGMRMALGARPWDLMRMILGQGLRLVGIGDGDRAGGRGGVDAVAGEFAVRSGRQGSGDVRRRGDAGAGDDGVRVLPAGAACGGSGPDAVASRGVRR